MPEAGQRMEQLPSRGDFKKVVEQTPPPFYATRTTQYMF